MKLKVLGDNHAWKTTMPMGLGFMYRAESEQVTRGLTETGMLAYKKE